MYNHRVKIPTEMIEKPLRLSNLTSLNCKVITFACAISRVQIGHLAGKCQSSRNLCPLAVLADSRTDVSFGPFHYMLGAFLDFKNKKLHSKLALKGIIVKKNYNGKKNLKFPCC